MEAAEGKAEGLHPQEEWEEPKEGPLPSPCLIPILCQLKEGAEGLGVMRAPRQHMPVEGEVPVLLVLSGISIQGSLKEQLSQSLSDKEAREAEP